MQKMVHTHVHTQITNSILLEAPNHFNDYLNKMEEMDDIVGIIFTEHGNNLSWGKKYSEINKRKEKYLQLAKENPEESEKYIKLANKFKYIHAFEGYTCLNGDDKSNFHVCVYALNDEGRKEVNSLISKAYRRDGHFYKRPRFYIDELLSCKNIAITTACAQGLLSNEKSEVYKKTIDWAKDNKDKFFLEIQAHELDKQKVVNDLAIKLHEEFGFNLITSNDCHYVDLDGKKTKEILERNRNTVNKDDYVCDLSFKSAKKQYEDLKTIGIDEKYIENAMENTIKLFNMCEEYEIDKSFKFPQITNNPKKELLKRSLVKLKKLGLHKNEVYLNRMLYELDAMEKLNALDYIILFSDWITWCKENDIAVGASRGSAGGSLVTYLTNITNIDPIQWNLSWDRFMNVERITMPDIDVDIEPSRRDEAKKWFYNHPKLNVSEILTFTTQAWKGASDIACRVHKVKNVIRFKELYGNLRQSEGLSDGDKFKTKSSKTIAETCNWFEEKEKGFGEVVQSVINLEGCITAIGTHPAGVLVVDKNIDLEKEIGIIQIEDKDNEYKIVSQLTMKELEEFGFIKADALGLANVETINRTCKMIGIEYPNPQTFNFEDENVWQDIAKARQMIFQFEDNKSHEYLAQALSLVKTEDKLQTMSMMSGLIRPSGESIRNRFLNGELGENGHEVINNEFKETMQYCIYQEQIIQFLNKFCGYSYSRADIVRRKISKKGSKEDFDKMMKEIRTAFENYFPKHWDITQEQINNVMDAFLAIIESARRYGFNKSHAISYTMLGYMGGYFRYYYPIQYVTANLNVFKNKPDKMKDIHYYIQQFMPDVKIMQHKFPNLSLEYTCDVDNKIIYEGSNGIKSVGKNAENAFLQLPRDVKFNDIIEVWVYMKDNGISGAGKTEFINLNRLGFFSNLKFKQKRNELAIMLLTNDKTFGKGSSYKYDPKQKKETGLNKIKKVYEEIEKIPDEDFSDIENAKFELELLGHTDLRFDIENLYYVLSVKKPYGKYICRLYNMKTGEIETLKMQQSKCKKSGGKIPENEFIQVVKFLGDVYFPPEKINGKTVSEKTGEKEWLIESYTVIDI
jgi:DNA polymerase-3 subunit alpha